MSVKVIYPFYMDSDIYDDDWDDDDWDEEDVI